MHTQENQKPGVNLTPEREETPGEDFEERQHYMTGRRGRASWWSRLKRNGENIRFLKEGTTPAFSPPDLQYLARCSRHSRCTLFPQINASLKETRRQHYRSQWKNFEEASRKIFPNVTVLVIPFASSTPKSIIHFSLPCSLPPRKLTSTNCITWAFLPSVWARCGLTDRRHIQDIKR